MTLRASEVPFSWAVPGAIGSTTPNSGAFTTLSASGQFTSTVANGTAPFVVASSTVVANLNASQLLGGTWAVPGAIGSTTKNTGAFTTISATGQITSTLATGTAPFVVSSTTAVANLNASLLLGATWAAPGTIGSTTANTGAFTTLTANGATTFTAGTASTSSGTGTVVVTGGTGVSGDLYTGASINAGTSVTAAGTIRSNRTASSDVAFASYYTGSFLACFVAADGTFNWGPSTSATDVTLARNGVGQLQVAGQLTATSSIKSLSATAGIGYGTGAGGTVTQATSKSTGVTLNTACGQITMNAAALASGAKVTFTLTDSAIAATDMVDCCVASGGTANAYRANVTAVAAGSCAITVENITAGSLSEAPVITFAVIKAVSA